MPSHSAASTELLKHARAEKRVSLKFSIIMVFGNFEFLCLPIKNGCMKLYISTYFFQSFSSDKCFTFKTIVSQIW